MQCTVLHRTKSRIRIALDRKKLTMYEADILYYHLRDIKGVIDVKVYDRTAHVIVFFNGCEKAIKEALAILDFDDEEAKAKVPEHTGREINRLYENLMVKVVAERLFYKFLVPAPISYCFTAFKALKYIKEAFSSLKKGRVDVAVLDGASITASMLTRDFDTAGSIMFLLSLGEILEEWTHKKSVDDLARTMSLNIEKVWLAGEEEKLVSIDDVKVGDEIIVRMGSVIPVDGRVVAGDAVVNQASITGEPIGVAKHIGSYVYAGTVPEEGYLVVKVEKEVGSGRYDRIVKMIEESEKLKSETENRASALADRLVPYSLLGAVLTYGLTGNIMRAMSFLMADFSCALKLAMPISVLSAMRECTGYKINAKGGKFLEIFSEADTIIFDKTGTLTDACPKVADIVVFGDEDEREILRTAACLEEHYPHSMAMAVVEEAKRRNLSHEETHSEIEYVVAHGISSFIDGEKILIGSHHFLFQDEGVSLPDDAYKMDSIPKEYSRLYMARGGVLVAVICIEDPIREEAPAVINSLKKLGISKVVMMTGDNKATAEAVGKAVGVDEVFSEVLPEDKASFINEEKAKGRKVIMVGDGINDSPALSAADVGVAISTGAAIAREVADITITDDDLFQLVTLRTISIALMNRIKKNYRNIIAINGGLIGAGALGAISPTTSALIHNLSTLGISSANMTNLLK